jgi:general secretion pathway protein K
MENYRPARVRRASQKGGALLAVLWISAALTAIAFAMANTVRTETERTSTFSEGVRCWYLASGGVERMWLWVSWGSGAFHNEDGSPKFFVEGIPRYTMNFPTGVANVEIIPETAKLGLNSARPDDIFHLLTALTQDPARAQDITAAIVDWRTGNPNALTLFDQYYLSLTPSFRARHASFEQTEELLLVRGVTPDLFYGSATHDESGRLIPQPGLRDCLSVYGSDSMIDINHAEAPVLAAIGLPADVINQIIAHRTVAPYRRHEELNPLIQFGGPGGRRLTVGGNSIFTFRSTGRLRLPDGRLSDMSRTVSATLKFHQKPVNTPPVEMLRWYDY